MKIFNQEISERAKEDVRMHIASGWKLKKEKKDCFILIRNNSTFFGHVLVLLFLGGWFLGITNLLYWFFSREKKKILF